jgi:hypothetical protein
MEMELKRKHEREEIIVKEEKNGGNYRHTK